MPRLIVGLGRERDTVHAVVQQVVGVGLELTAPILGHATTFVPPEVREAAERGSRPALRQLADHLTQTIRQAAHVARLELRAMVCLSLHDVTTADVAGELAELTGLTVADQFAARDRSAGAICDLSLAAADVLLFASPTQARLLIHLDAVTTILHLPAGGKISQVSGLVAGPGYRLLDDMVALGTRHRHPSDPGGTRAVQGRCLEPLLTEWLRLPRLAVRPPRSILATHFSGTFLTQAFEQTRDLNGTLNDLLCTTTHWLAHSTRQAAQQWLPPATESYLSGAGVRNGFLRQRLTAEFGHDLQLLDALGTPAGARTACAAAVLAALLLDSVPANLPVVSGATGGRLLGRLTPGDARNWSQVSRWLADPLAQSDVNVRLAG